MTLAELLTGRLGRCSTKSFILIFKSNLPIHSLKPFLKFIFIEIKKQKNQKLLKTHWKIGKNWSSKKVKLAHVEPALHHSFWRTHFHKFFTIFQTFVFFNLRQNDRAAIWRLKKAEKWGLNRLKLTLPSILSVGHVVAVNFFYEKKERGLQFLRLQLSK